MGKYKSNTLFDYVEKVNVELVKICTNEGVHILLWKKSIMRCLHLLK